jgi:mediator of RNA polymerase II transcription subunit 16
LTKKHGPTINKVIIRIEPIQFDTTLCFAYSDGSIEYRDRENLALLPPLEGNARFSHLTQAGLTYADTEPCEQLLHVYMGEN